MDSERQTLRVFALDARRHPQVRVPAFGTRKHRRRSSSDRPGRVIKSRGFERKAAALDVVAAGLFLLLRAILTNSAWRLAAGNIAGIVHGLVLSQGGGLVGTYADGDPEGRQAELLQEGFGEPHAAAGAA